MDRFSALIARFALKVVPAIASEANLIVYEIPAEECFSRTVFSSRGPLGVEPLPNEVVVFSAMADWGGDANPLVAALPDRIELRAEDNQETALLVYLLKTEGQSRRCGSASVLDRLGEILMVWLLRAQIEKGAASPGLIGGLADPRLSRAIVAIHEQPGRNWRNEDLAKIAGLSLSRFAELFGQIVGITPMAYLRRWRMVLARQDIEGGERIQTVARRYGYGSSEALNHAFRRQFGGAPIKHRHLAAEQRKLRGTMTDSGDAISFVAHTKVLD